jgi:hypothetical protein
MYVARVLHAAIHIHFFLHTLYYTLLSGACARLLRYSLWSSSSRLCWYTPVYTDTSRYLSTLVLSRYFSKYLLLPVPYTAPIAFTIWVNQAGHGRYTVTVEYELQNEQNTLRDVVVSIPFQRAEPTVTTMDETYEVAGDSLDWTLPVVSEENATGAFEFEAEAEEQSEFFPMKVGFRMEKPVVDVDVSSCPFWWVGMRVLTCGDRLSISNLWIVVTASILARRLRAWRIIISLSRWRWRGKNIWEMGSNGGGRVGFCAEVC